MGFLRTAVRELAGMFVDDGALALLNLVLVLVVGVAVKAGLVGAAAGAAILLLGSLLILAESLARASRGKKD
jgi:hypothetical protein